MTAKTTEVQDAKQTAVARMVKYQPLAPVGDAGTLKALLEQMKGSISQALPKHVTPDRIIKTMLVAANRTPDLLSCTQASIIETISRAAELGLDLSGTLGEAYPVPFNNRVGDNWIKQCQLIIGYRGLAKLARQSGDVSYIEAEVVCENDQFDFEKGMNAKCSWKPPLKGERGEPIGAYSLVKLKDGGVQFDFMTTDDIDKIRRRSKSGSDRNGNAIGAWKSDWSAMAKKTVFRRLAKWLPLSAEKSELLMQAMEQDSMDYGSDIISVHRVDDESTSRIKRLADRLGAGEPTPDTTPSSSATSGDGQPQPTEQAEDDDEAAGQRQDDSATGGESTGDAKAEDAGAETIDAIVQAQAKKHGVSITDASARIHSHVKARFHTTADKLTDGQLATLMQTVEAGQLQH